MAETPKDQAAPPATDAPTPEAEPSDPPPFQPDLDLIGFVERGQSAPLETTEAVGRRGRQLR
jgi:hypothetical protein